MVEAALGYVKTSLPTVLVVHASFSMFAKTVMECLALTADVGTSMLVLSLLNTAERPGTNVPVMLVWQVVEILMFVGFLFVPVLIIPLIAADSPVLSPWNAVEIIATNIPQMFVEIPFQMLILVASY